MWNWVRTQMINDCHKRYIENNKISSQNFQKLQSPKSQEVLKHWLVLRKFCSIHQETKISQSTKPDVGKLLLTAASFFKYQLDNKHRSHGQIPTSPVSKHIFHLPTWAFTPSQVFREELVTGASFTTAHVSVSPLDIYASGFCLPHAYLISSFPDTNRQANLAGLSVCTFGWQPPGISGTRSQPH